jgi:hypothetical protein
MSNGRIEVYLDGIPVEVSEIAYDVLTDMTEAEAERRKQWEKALKEALSTMSSGNKRSSSKHRRRMPLKEFAVRSVVDPAGARRAWESGVGIDLSRSELRSAWNSVSSLDMSNHRMRKMRKLAMTFAETGNIVIARDLIDSLRIGHDESNGGEVQYAMTGLELLAIVGTVATLVALGIWIGDTLEDTFNDDEDDEGGDTITVNNTGNGDVEVNK